MSTFLSRRLPPLALYAWTLKSAAKSDACLQKNSRVERAWFSVNADTHFTAVRWSGNASIPLVLISLGTETHGTGHIALST